MTLTELIAALEKATGPSEELNGAIAEADGWVCGVVVDDIVGPEQVWRKGKQQRLFPPRFTSSIDAALTLHNPRWERHVIKASTVNGFMVEVREPSEYGWTQGPPVYRGEHPTEPIAYVLAALRSRT